MNPTRQSANGDGGKGGEGGGTEGANMAYGGYLCTGPRARQFNRGIVMAVK